MPLYISINRTNQPNANSFNNLLIFDVDNDLKDKQLSIMEAKELLEKIGISAMILPSKSVEEDALKNIEIVTTDMIDGNLSEIIKHTKDAIKRGIKFIGLDSTLMLFVEGMSGEQEVTEIFRQLQKITVQNDVLFFIITQGSKEDNRDGKVSIFGSQKANHFCKIYIILGWRR